ncbi:protein-disulfide reductase DsbD domain-containing protein [Parvibaculum sp.]|uniref:protein-disulfide reductase DsbD domain-containing protein n=1 Tax=Parvibaculum sp. TaxID=2024848 RepID=UPI0025EE0899|nr:protein-disulfide reductase DsbD domain-containing protein [Parvibaculum sp.]
MRMRAAVRFGFLMVCLGAWFAATPLAAAPGEGVRSLALVSAARAHDGSAFLAGLDLQLADGWKTYWEKPGDSGIPPVFDWSASENVAGVELRWPAPERFDAPGDITFGYKHGLIWPLRIVPEDGARPVTLRLSVLYGICADICVPRRAELELTVPPAMPDMATGETTDAPRLRAALARVPVPPADPDLIEVKWRENEAPTLEVRLKHCGPGCTPPQLIVTGPRNTWFGTPRVKRKGDTVRYTMEVEVLSPAMLEGEELSFILADPDRAYVIRKIM